MPVVDIEKPLVTSRYATGWPRTSLRMTSTVSVSPSSRAIGREPSSANRATTRPM